MIPSTRILVWFSLVLTPSISYSNPLGEEAYYEVDSSINRTSTIVKSGHLTVTTDKFLPDDSHGPSYNNRVSYEFQLRMVGPKIGEENFSLIQKIYSTRFVSEVRKQEIVTTSQFHAKYLGQEDVDTMDGLSYPNSEFILLYNIDLTQDKSFNQLIKLIFSAYISKPFVHTEPIDEIEDLKIKLAIHKAVPLIHSPKIDISGTYRGTFFRVGLDYIQ